MNAHAPRAAGPIQRLLALFDQHADIESLAFYGSDHGGVEARALSRLGAPLRVDLHAALGDHFWRELCLRARCGAPVVIARSQARAQAFDLLGHAEASRYESEQLAHAAHAAAPEPRRRSKGKRRIRL